MDDIIAAHDRAQAQIRALLGNERTAPNDAAAEEILRIVAEWRRFVHSRVDRRTAIGFDSISGGSRSPLSWHSFTMKAVSAYTAYADMEQKLAWLLHHRPVPNVNIQATGSVVTVGNDNRVTATINDLGSALAALRTAIESSTLSTAAKQDALADVDALASQARRSTPDRGMLGTLWQRIQDVGAVGGFVQTLQMAAPFVLPLIGA